MLLVAGLTLFVPNARAAVSPARHLRAVAAYDEAQQLRDALESHPEGSRSKEEYKKVVAAYYEVYRLDPAYSNTPAALASIAELYREMGREFSSDSYFLESIRSYRFVMEQYPQSHSAHQALFIIGEVYRQDLEDPDEARKSLEEYVRLHPQAEKTDEAKGILKQLDKQLDRQSAERTHDRPAPAPVETVVEEPPSIQQQVEKHSGEGTSGLRQVTAVRRWVGANYSRIVIEVGGDAVFESMRLAHPDRIVVDLQNARLSPELVNKTFPVEDGFLRQIRVAQFSSHVTRVVLDVEKIESYSIFSLPNPFRLVIDIQGVAPTQMARTVKPTVPATSDTRKLQAVRVPESRNPAPATHVEAAAEPQPTPPPRMRTAPRKVIPEDEEGTSSVPASRKPKSDETSENAATEVAPPILPAGPTESGSRTLTRALGLKIGRIVIDPGHGGHDTGTIGPTGLEEKDVVLDVGLKLKKLLELNSGCEVIMTRSDDTFIPLEERTAIANEKSADLFISLHANASRDDTARGIETYYLNFTSNPDALEVAARENATSQQAVHELQDLIKKIAMTEKIEESQDFARQVQREVYSRVTKASGAQRDRGIKKAPFVVLIGANMPSVLGEISFLTNPRDERLLRRSDYREKIAYALYEGILNYVKNLGGMRTVQRLASDQTSAARRPDF